jgi:hypothetical protein
MDKILNGVEALTSKSGLLNGLVSLTERFTSMPQEATADVWCGSLCKRRAKMCDHTGGWHTITKYARNRKACQNNSIYRTSERCGC